MSEMGSMPVATTSKRALATSTSILKGCGSVAILLLFLLATATCAFATAAATTTTLTSPAASSSYASGASVTLTATVAPTSGGGTVTNGGTVTFKNGSTSVGTCTLSSGTCSTATTTLPVGVLSLTAAYTATASFAASTSSPATSVTITSTTTTTLGASPTSTALGTAVTLTATITPSAAAGNVSFFDNGTSLGTAQISSGTATLAVTTLTVGTHANITATYAGNGVYLTSSSAAAPTVTIVQGTSTATALATSASTLASGASETLTATVTPSGSTGKVNFFDNGTTSLGSGTLGSGTASLALTTLAVGAHSITATYVGDATHDPSTSSPAASVTVTSTTTTTLAAKVNGSAIPSAGTAIGSFVVLSATVAAPSGAGTPSGSVSFYSGSLSGTLLGTSALSGGVANLTVSFQVANTYSIFASYAGSSPYLASSSGATSVKVIAGTVTTTALAASASSIAYNNTTLTLTATLSPKTATGTVAFYDNGSTLLGTQAVTTTSGTTQGTAVLSITSFVTPLVAGSNSITAVYLGSTTNDASNPSAAAVVTVTTPTTTALTVSAGPHYYGNTVTLNAAVAPTVGSATVPGSVTFYDNGVSIGTGTLSGGTASLALSTLVVGSHPITATYAGNASFVTSNSASTSVSVVATTTQVVAVASGPSTKSYGGASFSLTATVTAVAGGATITGGNVTFYDSATQLGKVAVSGGTATFTVTGSMLAAGKHYLIANYGGLYNSGTAEFTSSLSTAAQVTITNTQTITFTAPASPVTYGASPVSLSASSTSNLAVTFAASGACSVNGTTLTYLSAGSCTVTASQAGNNSFVAATPVQQTVTVNQATLLITASSPASFAYGAAVPTVTPAYATFVNGDTSASLTTAPTCTTAYTTTSAPGPYTTSCSGAADANYAITYATGSFTVTKASQTFSHWYNATTVYGTPVSLSAVSSSGLTVAYSVVSGPATVNGVTLTPTGVGAIVVAANQAGNANYTAATQVTKTVTVYPAPLLITASSPPSMTFSTAVPSITPTYATFVNGDSSASLTTPPSCFTPYTTSSHPGTYSTICYGAVDPNYVITYANGSFSVTKATPSVSGWPTSSTITYGQALSQSTLTGGTSNPAGAFAWTTGSTIPHVGGPAQGVTFTPTDTTDYTNVAGTVSVTVNKAAPTVTWPTASAITWGQALSASRLSGGSSNGTFSWTSASTVPASMGSNTESVTFTPTDGTDYNNATGTVSVTVNKATPVVTWPTASAINFGQKLSKSNLTGGSANTDGAFSWTSPNLIPAAGTPNQSVTFTPSNTSEFSTVTHTVIVTVNKAAPTVSSWPSASAITYGQALSASTLSGGSTAGRFAWTSPGTIPGAGTPTESVTFTPTDSTDYSTATSSISVTVNQATPSVTAWPTAAPILLGQALSDSALTGGSANTAGEFDWTTTSTEPGVGTTSYNVTFTPTDSTDFVTTSGWVAVTVNACGLQDSTNSSYSTGLNVYTAAASPADLTLDVEGANESAICAVNSGPSDSWVVAVSYPIITSGAASSYIADSGSNGTNAAVLAYGTEAVSATGATITITDDGNGDPSSISTSNDYGNGVFASMGGTVNITDAYISTQGNGAHGLDATYAGTLNLTNVTATTSGNNSSVIVAGIGGGNVTSSGSTYISSGSRSSGIRAAGTASSVNLSGDSVTALDASAVVIEGGNSVVIGPASVSLSGALGDDHGVFFYYNPVTADSTAGTGTFTMTNGSITYTCDATSLSPAPCPAGSASNDQNNPATLFSVANTSATITLTDVTVTNATPTDANANGTLLTAAALNSGTPGSNGGSVIFNAYGEALTGDVIVDSISTVNLNLAADSAEPSVPSILTGTINGANTSGATVNMTIDATSTWVVTGNSYLTTLSNAVGDNSNITCYTPGQCSVTVGGQLLTGVN